MTWAWIAVGFGGVYLGFFLLVIERRSAAQWKQAKDVLSARGIDL